MQQDICLQKSARRHVPATMANAGYNITTIRNYEKARVFEANELKNTEAHLHRNQVKYHNPNPNCSGVNRSCEPTADGQLFRTRPPQKAAGLD